MLLTILNRFENNTIVYEFCQQQIKLVLKLIQDQDVVKVDVYHFLIKDPKNRAHLNKKNLNQSLDNASTQFSNVVSKNSINYKISLSPGRDHLSGKGIVTNSLPYQGAFIDDSDLQQALNPNKYQEESSQYLSMRTQEKMIVNQLQCFINTGIKVLVEFIRQ